jgi:hypothetical protein
MDLRLFLINARVMPQVQPIVSRLRRVWIFVPKTLYLLFVTGVLFGAFAHWFYDDPFITYRYADNLIHGLGFVYNPGYRVLSTTTPLFTLLLALLGNLWSDLPRLAILIGAFSLGMGGLFLWELGRVWQSPMVGWTGLLLYPTFSLLLSTLGSETPLVLAFCLGIFVFYGQRRYHLTAIFTALAILTRPDAVLVAVILAVYHLVAVHRSIPWSSLLLAGILTIPWFAFAWVYFGSPLPVTLAAKQHQGAMTSSQQFAPGILTIAEGYAALWEYWLEAVLAVIGIVIAARRARPWLMILAWALLYFFAYSVLGVSRYPWYYAPLVPAFVVLVGLGASSVKGASLPELSSSWLRRIPVLLILLLTVFQIRDIWQLLQQPDDRFEVYRAIGEWLKSNSSPESTVGTLEVGIIGYYAPRSMVDFAGLIQPSISAQLTPHATYEDAALWAVEQYHPDYLVLRDKSFPRLEGDYVARQCALAQRFVGQAYGYAGDLSVYSCR